MDRRTTPDLIAARKRSLVLESELNRLLIAADLQQLRSRSLWAADFARLAGHARHLLAFAGPVAGLLVRRRGHRIEPGGSKWLGRASAGVKLAAPLLQAWRLIRRRSARATPPAG